MIILQLLIYCLIFTLMVRFSVCGGAIDGNDLDLYMNSESACNRWGRRYVKVYVLSNADRVTVKLDKEETE